MADRIVFDIRQGVSICLMWMHRKGIREVSQHVDGNIQFEQQVVVEFCRRWRIVELSLFGSVLRDDFGPDSDVDVLVVFAPDAPWSYWDWGAMTEQLGSIFGRSVDLVEKRSVVNPYRRHHILTSRRIIHDHAA